ncbi:MAG: tripartite tricarboxylate transporter substrate binding protein, partial [Pseudomonadota bacterium]
MKYGKTGSRKWIIALVMLAFFIAFPVWVFADDYPNKPITIYVGWSAGGSTDVTTRVLAAEVEKILGVPVIVENKPGAGSTVGASLTYKKEPDGYTLGSVSSGAFTLRPFMLNLPYDPLNDFTFIWKYSQYVGGIMVLAENPVKTVDDFVAWAKKNPGLSYASSGMYTQQQLAVELFGQCKGLKFTHVPCKGGSASKKQLMGKHVDFLAGTGSHITMVRQGVFRMLTWYNTIGDKRTPDFPDVPTQKELGCKDAPPLGYLIVGPKGMPESIRMKLADAFKKAQQTPSYQKLRKNMSLPDI